MLAFVGLKSVKFKACLTCLQILAGWSEQYGPIYRWRFGPKDILVVTDPVEVSKLCSKEANLPKFALAYRPINTVSSPLQSGFASKLTGPSRASLHEHFLNRQANLHKTLCMHHAALATHQFSGNSKL